MSYYGQNHVKIGFNEILLGLAFGAVGFLTGLFLGGMWELAGGGFVIGVIFGTLMRESKEEDE